MDDLALVRGARLRETRPQVRHHLLHVRPHVLVKTRKEHRKRLGNNSPQSNIVNRLDIKLLLLIQLLLLLLLLLLILLLLILLLRQRTRR